MQFGNFSSFDGALDMRANVNKNITPLGNRFNRWFTSAVVVDLHERYFGCFLS
jgi:hypothetical protein